MKTLPLMLAMIATSFTVSLASASPIADFNNDGNVDAMDLVLLVGNMNATCDDTCPTDLNEDGITDTSDLMELMGQWGPVPNWEPQDVLEEEETNPSPTRDENRDMSWQGQAPVLLDAILLRSNSPNISIVVDTTAGTQQLNTIKVNTQRLGPQKIMLPCFQWHMLDLTGTKMVNLQKKIK